MTIVTRPEDSPGGKPITTTAPVPGRTVMSMTMANALTSGGAMSMQQLHVCVGFYRSLMSMLTVAGPQFSPLRNMAVEMHNKAVRRINGVNEDVKRMERERLEGRLLEIER